MNSIETKNHGVAPHPAENLSGLGAFFYEQRQIFRRFIWDIRKAYSKPDMSADHYNPPEWYQAYDNVYNEVINASDLDHALQVVDTALVDARLGDHPRFRPMVLNLRNAILEGQQKVNGAVTAAAPKSHLYFNLHRDQAENNAARSSTDANENV